MNEATRIYYDEELDYLTIFVGTPRSNYGDDIADGITLFKDEDTEETIGIGIQEFKEKTKTLQELEFKLPFRITFAPLTSK